MGGGVPRVGGRVPLRDGLGSYGGERSLPELAGRFREIIRADLMYSRYFDVKEDPAGSDALSADTDALKFWNVSGAGWLVTAKAAQNEKNWTFNARLYDVKTGKVKGLHDVD